MLRKAFCNLSLGVLESSADSQTDMIKGASFLEKGKKTWGSKHWLQSLLGINSLKSFSGQTVWGGPNRRGNKTPELCMRAC